VSYHTSAGGPRTGASSAPKAHRGSHKRVNRIKWQQHTPLGFWIFVFVVLLLLVAGVPWLLSHLPHRHWQVFPLSLVPCPLSLDASVLSCTVHSGPRRLEWSVPLS
jgi:hypothetical protein